MLARNYKRHLLDHHKGENPSDLRGKIQRPVNHLFAPRNSKRKKVDSDDDLFYYLEYFPHNLQSRVPIPILDPDIQAHGPADHRKITISIFSSSSV